MKLIIVALLALTGAGCGVAQADGVPLPRPRPAQQAVMPHGAPTPCDRRLAGMANLVLMPRLIGPGACGGDDLIELDSVRLPDGAAVSMHPKPTLNCPMAESFAAWLRDAVAPVLAKKGAILRSVENYDSYECRSRNRVKGAKLSEHAHGDAIDVRALDLDNGRELRLTDVTVDKQLRLALRDSACHRFTTVLGPGDPYHADHIHLDEIVRRNGYRICQWDVREPVPLVANTDIPLPPPRPPVAGTTHSSTNGPSL